MPPPNEILTTEVVPHTPNTEAPPSGTETDGMKTGRPALERMQTAENELFGVRQKSADDSGAGKVQVATNNKVSDPEAGAQRVPVEAVMSVDLGSDDDSTTTFPGCDKKNKAEELVVVVIDDDDDEIQAPAKKRVKLNSEVRNLPGLAGMISNNCFRLGAYAEESKTH